MAIRPGVHLLPCRMTHGRCFRLDGYDYSSPNWYFVTVIVEGRRRLLGRLNKSGVELTRLGEVVGRAWDEALRQRPWVLPAAFVVMPNHIHGVIGWQNPPAGRDTSLGKFVG